MPREVSPDPAADRQDPDGARRGPNLTALLHAWSEGDSEALAVLAPLVNHELREMARRVLTVERRDGRWRPTDLLQETYLRLLDWRDARWQDRTHFFSTAARMMRHAVVDAARARRRAKRGDGIEPVPLDGIDVAAPAPDVDLLAIDQAIKSLAAVSARAAQVVELRFFGGFTIEETAETLGVSVRTVINDWNMARAWLFHELSSRTAWERLHE
jgi:RNA polymerase sigma-70 factor, ECF subfamily